MGQRDLGWPAPSVCHLSVYVKIETGESTRTIVVVMLVVFIAVVVFITVVVRVVTAACKWMRQGRPSIYTLTSAQFKGQFVICF